MHEDFKAIASSTFHSYFPGAYSGQHWNGHETASIIKPCEFIVGAYLLKFIMVTLNQSREKEPDTGYPQIWALGALKFLSLTNVGRNFDFMYPTAVEATLPGSIVVTVVTS